MSSPDISPDTLPGLAQWFAAQHTVRQGLNSEDELCSAERAAEIVGELMRALKTTDAFTKIDTLFLWSKERQYATDLIVLGGALLSLALKNNLTSTNYDNPALASYDLFCHIKESHPVFMEVLFDRNLNHARSVWTVTIKAAVARSQEKSTAFDNALTEIVEAADFVLSTDSSRRLPQISSSLPEEIDQWI